jgi:phosphoglycolate phosphatase
MTAARVRAVAFDLDGTLIDTAPDIGAALNQALDKHHLPIVATDTARVWIGDGPDRLIERALDHLKVPPQPDLQQRLRAEFDAATLAAPLVHGRVFNGITALLADWFGKLPMVVVTNKPTALSKHVLDAAGLLDFFAAVLGADHAEQRKPAPALLHNAASQLNVAADALLMVGDSVNDLRCAHAAGCPAAWVAWGYGQPDAAIDAWRIDTPSDLAARVAAL